MERLTEDQIKERQERELKCGHELDAVITATLEKHNCQLDIACLLTQGEAPSMKLNITAKSLVDTASKFDTADLGGQ